MAEIAVLRTHIVNYAKTREVYMSYRLCVLTQALLAGIIPNLVQVIILIYLYFDILFDTLSEVPVLHP